jgi:hypothetical protein
MYAGTTPPPAKLLAAQLIVTLGRRKIAVGVALVERLRARADAGADASFRHADSAVVVTQSPSVTTDSVSAEWPRRRRMLNVTASTLRADFVKRCWQQ